MKSRASAATARPANVASIRRLLIAARTLAVWRCVTMPPSSVALPRQLTCASTLSYCVACSDCVCPTAVLRFARVAGWLVRHFVHCCHGARQQCVVCVAAFRALPERRYTFVSCSVRQCVADSSLMLFVRGARSRCHARRVREEARAVRGVGSRLR
jgi:hypothetical protein